MMDAIRACVVPSRKKDGEVERRPTPVELLAQRAESNWKYHRRKSFPRLERLEKRTGRIVSIETASTEANLKKCHPQSQALLFRLLPRELRIQIYDFLTPEAFHHGRINFPSSDSDDDNFKNPIHTLSSTCRLAWLETNSLASHQTHHTFPMTSRFPSTERGEDRLYPFLCTLTPNNRQQLHSLQIFCGWKWLETSLPQYSPLLLGYTGSCPEILILVVRREDLWIDSHGAMSTDVSWLEGLLSSSGMERLREVRLEVEVLRDEGEGRRTPMRLGPSVDQYRLLGRKIEGLELRAWRSVEGRGRKFVLQGPFAGEEEMGRELEDLAGVRRSAYGREKVVFVWKVVEAELTEPEISVQVNGEEPDESWVVAAREKATEKSMARRKPGVMAMWYERKWTRQGSLLKLM